MTTGEISIFRMHCLYLLNISTHSDLPMARNNWQREELLIAFSLYCEIPFAQISARNPKIIRAAEIIGRSPGALSMKLGNFGRLDPALQSRGVTGLSHGGRGEIDVWNEFNEKPEPLAIESEEARKKILSVPEQLDPELPEGPTDALRSVRVRMVQSFFRRTVLSGYNFTCCFCGLSISEMLIASHIIPWSVSVELRADPRNGIALCAFHDKAFDRGILSVDEAQRILVSGVISIPSDNQLARVGLLELANKPIKLADRFQADTTALSYHRTNIFKH